jgi:uncharacterized paraquat-inducible protein A
MTMELTVFFAAYALVFLAVVLGAWLHAEWRRTREERRSERRCRCPYCGAEVAVPEPRRRVRCPRCWGRLEAERPEPAAVEH